MQILSQISQKFEEALAGWVENPAEYAARIAAAKDPKHGDYQANIAMPLARPLGRKPLEIADELIGRLSIDDLCLTPEVAGPGFINLRLRNEFLEQSIVRLLQDSRLSVQAAERSKTYVIDYSAPNVAKPMHVGHIRSTVIGDALKRILRYLGHEVIGDNHLGDWGTQFGMIIYGYKNFREDAAFEQEPVAELSRIYRIVQAIIGYQASEPKLPAAAEAVERARDRLKSSEDSDEEPKAKKKLIKGAQRELRNAEETLAGLQAKVDAVSGDAAILQLAGEHENLETRCQQETVKLHEGDEENLDLWKKFLPISITEIESVYQRLDVQFDYTYGESFYHPMLQGVVDDLKSRGLAEENDGAICVFLDGFDAPMIIQKRDGAFLYSTTDLATIEYRMKHFKPDAMLYVVDHRQGEHFQKLFTAARAIGHTEVEMQHVSFGTVLGKDGKPFKTRSGAVIGLDYLLDEAVERAYQVVNTPERLARLEDKLSDEQLQEIANVVGLGAIKYADLSHNRTSDYKFDIDAMVQLEGDTSTYIQYMYARSCSIIRRSEVELKPQELTSDSILLTHSAERALALHLLQFEDALLQSVDEYYPSVLCGYLYDLSKLFAKFFDQCPVLKAESEELLNSRLMLCLAASRVLKQGLSLLGIGTVERM